ncbi:MAG: GMC family oxidoreductase N-terminal domain-containing protein, partial [Bacteroidota bacterium]
MHFLILASILKGTTTMQRFDYIIVGAGSAGCVLAHRLSEDAGVTVALLEAGGSDRKFFIQTPAAYSKLHYSKVDWAFKTVPQPHVANRQMHQPRGKVLGGCSSTNCMAYIRGHQSDYDHWADLGNRGWNYAEVLPYFRKAEHNAQFNDQWHGQGGPLHVTHSENYVTPLGKAFVAAHEELGYPANPDFNGATQEGAGLFQFTIKEGRRCNTVNAYLSQSKTRPNLTVISQAMVQRVLVEGGTAKGVEYLANGGKKVQIEAVREVI